MIKLHFGAVKKFGVEDEKQFILIVILRSSAAVGSFTEKIQTRSLDMQANFMTFLNCAKPKDFTPPTLGMFM